MSSGYGTYSTSTLLNASGDFLHSVAEGQIPGHSVILKFGANADVATSFEPVWDFGGTYTYPAATEALQISSSDDTDVEQVTVVGLDASWAMQTATGTLTGQTAADITGTWRRVFRAYTTGATETAGTVYVSADGASLTNGVPGASDARAAYGAVDQQTLMAIYTVPVGYTLHLYNFEYSSAKLGSAASVTGQLTIREPGGVFRTKHKIEGEDGTHVDHQFRPLLTVPEKTDIQVRMKVGSGTAACSAGFDGVLVAD